MYVRYHHGAHRREVELQVLDRHALVADLATALDPGTPGCALRVDGRVVPAGCLMSRAGIVPGSLIEPAAAASRSDAAPSLATDHGAVVEVR
ncbi:MAG TPA: hypothetical protein VGM93_02170, partial [Acidimicrobiales bacterium]